jgi:hypothetical protein
MLRKGWGIATYLVGLEAGLAVYDDLEETFCVVQLDWGNDSTVTVRVVALAKGQCVWTRMRLDIDGPIVQEPPH